jgi:purine-binding chemotaxis protein CheW
MEQTIEVMRALPLERLTGMPQYICGLSVIRGEPVPVVHLGLLLGQQTAAYERLVLIKLASGRVAMGIDSVVSTNALAATTGQLPPLILEAGDDRITGIGTSGTELIFFLRTARLVPDDVLSRIRSEALSCV